MGKQTTKTGKGVDALFEQEQQEKLAKRRADDARRKREKRAKLKDAVELVASEIAKPAARVMPKQNAAAHPDGYVRVAGAPQQTVRMTFTGKLTEEGQRAVKAALDEPAPVRLTLAALAQAFDEACAGVDLAEGALENATRIRDKAKTALDQACARRANGEQA